MHQYTIKVKALTRPIAPIELIELTVSDGSTFTGASVVRVMIDNK
jgi:hypothetical protein